MAENADQIYRASTNNKKKLVYRRICNKPELAVEFIFMSKEGRDC